MLHFVNAPACLAQAPDLARADTLHYSSDCLCPHAVRLLCRKAVLICCNDGMMSWLVISRHFLVWNVWYCTTRSWQHWWNLHHSLRMFETLAIIKPQIINSYHKELKPKEHVIVCSAHNSWTLYLPSILQLIPNSETYLQTQFNWSSCYNHTVTDQALELLNYSLTKYLTKFQPYVSTSDSILLFKVRSKYNLMSSCLSVFMYATLLYCVITPALALSCTFILLVAMPAWLHAFSSATCILLHYWWNCSSLVKLNGLRHCDVYYDISMAWCQSQNHQ
jgi:hypothetical protein